MCIFVALSSASFCIEHTFVFVKLNGVSLFII